MLIIENIHLALSGLLANKMRALLTMLGIIIGISSVIAIMTVGNSMKNSISTSMAEMGANHISIRLKSKTIEEEVTEDGKKFGAGLNRTISEEYYFTNEMLTNLKIKFTEQIDALSFSETVGSATVEKEDLTGNVSIIAGNSGYFIGNEIDLVYGREFSNFDQESGKKIAIISDQLVDSIFNGNAKDALESKLSVNIEGRYYDYVVIGIYQSSEEANSQVDTEDTTDLYIPFLTGKNQTHSGDYFKEFTVISNPTIDTTTLISELEEFFKPYYENQEEVEVSITSMESMISSMTDMLSTVSIAISIIAGISLLVGGIGVMNIMMVSITERTREIGTRKALGATNGSIRLQFIMESIIICVLGGFMGIILGIIMGIVAVKIMGYQASPSMGGIFFSVLFSIFIGVFFGYYPANKAAKLNPIDALRYE